LVAHGPPGGYVFTMAADYEMMWRGALMHSFLTEQRVSISAGLVLTACNGQLIRLQAFRLSFLGLQILTINFAVNY